MDTAVQDQFAALVSQDRQDEDIDLLRAALTIARLEYPALQSEPYVEMVDNFAAAARSQLNADVDPIDTFCAINGVLFEQEGFRGNSEDYYDPRNSFLNEVLDRKLGIPITLSVVYMEVARRIGIPLFGVGMPGHFLLKFYDVDGREYFLDPYSGGQLLSDDDCQLRMQQIYGPEIVMNQGHLTTVRKRQILTRMLNNLRTIYMTRRMLKKALGVVDLILAIYPRSADDVKQRALLRYQLGHMRGAISDLDDYVKMAPEASDAEEMTETALAIRRSLAMMN